VLTALLGTIFLIGQGGEYFSLFRQHITISQSLFGTTFFTLTGFHGLHVAVGIAALAIAMWFPIAIETVALYWQFVDLVWIVIFAVVYLGAFR
ncbi:MAG: cytochrome c oxidase subunit 3, partial [Acidobacteriia bacterium]|nr:cytochrome c oxidase subunit 3 [Terriglobia bacterium]